MGLPYHNHGSMAGRRRGRRERTAAIDLCLRWTDGFYAMGMTTLTVRLDADDLDRLDAIADALAERAGVARITRPKALRIVLDAGFDILGAQFRQSGSQLKR
jgi:hypothetical protein